MTDRPDADDKGAPRRDGRRGRPERTERPDRARPASEAEPDPGAVTPRALRPSGPSRKLGRALPRVGDNTASVTEESPDRSAVDPFRFGDARLVPQREDAAADDADDEFDDQLVADEEPVGGWAADADVDDAPADDAPADDVTADDAPTDDVPTDDSLGFGGARLVSSRRDDPAPPAPSTGAATPAGSDDGFVPAYTTIDSTPRAGSASTAAALTALSALLARFDDGAVPSDTAAPEPGSGEPDEPSTDVSSTTADEPSTDDSSTTADEPSTDDSSTTADEPVTASIEIVEAGTGEPATTLADEPDTASMEIIEPDTDEPAPTVATGPDTDDERNLLVAVSGPTHDDGDEDRPASDTIGEIDRQLAELAEQLDTEPADVPADPAPSTLFDHATTDAGEAAVGPTDEPDTVATDPAAHQLAGTDATDDTTEDSATADATDTIATDTVDDAETADADIGTAGDTAAGIAEPLPDTDVADDAVAADDTAEPTADADTVDVAESADADTGTAGDTAADTAEPVADADTAADTAEPVADADTVGDSTAASAPSEGTDPAHDGIDVDGESIDTAPASPAALVSDSLSPSQRVALDRELRNRLGNAVNDPEQVAAVAATLPPTIPARAKAAPKPAKAKTPSPTVKKLTRWDRPAPPRDWRYFVGMLGRTLIVTGLLMFGFVAYQLWGTGIATARAQSQLANQFEELVAENTGSLPPDATAPPATTSPADDPTPATTAAPGDTTAPAPTPTIAPGGVVQDLPEIEPGKALARLEIARMGLTGGDALIVLPGVDPETLQDGPGHYPDTPLPGQLGNAAIAGHRTTWGEPFARIDELVAGDEIIVTMVTGDRFVYEVASTEIVNPEDYYVVTTTDPTVAELTLTSCHPRFSARQRIAVHAFLKAEESDPVGLPTFYDIEANTTPISGDDPTVTVPDSVTDSLDDSVESGDASVAPDATTPTTVPAVVPGAPGSGPDALTAGWFHDSAAWPHIGAWAVVCALIAIGAYFLSKRFRNYAVGWSIMVLPFVVCLYFLYENVNRLLPPGL